MHQNAFEGRALPRPAGAAHSAPQTPSWIKGVEKEERGVGKRKGEGMKGGEGAKQRGGPPPNV